MSHLPRYFQLNADDPSSVTDFLIRHERLEEGEKVQHCEVAGDGNMNLVVRVNTSQRSFILKQSLPWVRKYPMVAAPVDRIATEAAFYELVRTNETLKKYTPEVFWFDNSQNVLCMEDFGPSSDYTFIYRKGEVIERMDMTDIAKAVSELHFCFNENTVPDRSIQNLELRYLNHQHIFELPLAEQNGFDLDSILSGLQSKTERFRKDGKLKARAKELGAEYLVPFGPKLLHGDYYPGSWLRTQKGFRMIDPEFGFFGLPEFELAVSVAHLKMAQQSDSLIKDLFVYYHFDSRFDGSLFSKFTGMEMIRRIIGLAQLPLQLDLHERLELLDEAYELVVNG